MTKIITISRFLSWLKQLADTYTIIAPITHQGMTLYRPVNNTGLDKINLGFTNTDLSAKSWFFPPSETLFTKRSNNGSYQIIPPSVEREAILWGIRPCDAKGIALIDKAFLAEPADVFYQERRLKTILIGLSCSKPCPECFCTSLAGGPQDPTHLDALFTETKDGYIVHAITDKGKRLFVDAPLQDAEIEPPTIPAPNLVPTENITEIVHQVFNNSYWDRVADRCLHCKICAYVCPCCYCFDIRDYTSKGKIERIRSWESCQSPGFVRLAGGHDPRPTKGARLRQRWYHKFLYFPQRFGEVKCTGCGRCVRSCPVNVDIREIITDIQRLRA